MTRRPVLSAMFLTLVSAVAANTPDFVVIGGGTSGCVLAARLCNALPKANILLLERAKPRKHAAEFLVSSVRQSFSAYFSPLVSEVFPSLPNAGLFDRSELISTGNTLGGSSAINGMQWTSPVADSVDRWAVHGLSSATAVRFFRRAFRKVGFGQPPLNLRFQYAGDYEKAARKAGFDRSFAPFDNRVRNAVWYQAIAATKQGRRVDSCTAYVKPVLNGRCRRNLKLIQGATVTKLLLGDEQPRRVKGVMYVHSDAPGKNKTILVNEEVLVAAGPYGSPKLLQLSGIGPAEHLRAVGVEPKIDLPVGSSTQARATNTIASVYTGVPLDPANNSTLLNSEEERRRWDKGEESVLGKGTSSVNGIVGKNGYLAVVHGFSEGVLDIPLMLSGCVGNPTSRGLLRIRDANPFSAPEVQLNLLGKRKDVRTLQECLKKVREVPERFPASFAVRTEMSAGEITEADVRNSSSFGLHFVGGCQVGKVVRGNLKVKGTEGLRVIDASVFRQMPMSAGPMASTYMLAEFAAERLSCKYRGKFDSRGGSNKSCSIGTKSW